MPVKAIQLVYKNMNVCSNGVFFEGNMRYELRLRILSQGTIENGEPLKIHVRKVYSNGQYISQYFRVIFHPILVYLVCVWR